MSLAVDAALFNSAVHHLLLHPETLEKLAAFTGSARPHEHPPRSESGRSGEERGLGIVPVDILESAKEYTFVLDVPGLSKSDVQVTLEDEKILVIQGGGKRKRDDGEEEGCRFLRLERKATAKFVRKFRLLEDADSSAISAKCENGVLTVVVGKTPPPESKKRTLQVNVA